MDDRVWRRAAHALAGVVALGGSVLGFTALVAPAAASGAFVSHELTLSPNLDLGSVTLGDITLQPETVTNTGAGEVTVIGITSSGADPQDFLAFPDLTCPYLDAQDDIHLPPNGSCNVFIYFFPGALGARSATLTFVDQDGDPLGSVSWSSCCARSVRGSSG